MSRHPSPIHKVTVVSTGSASLRPEHMYGSRKPTLWRFARSNRWVTVPVNVFVIEHRDGLVLFDTGIDPRVAVDADYWPDAITRWFAKRLFRFAVGLDEGLADQLERIGHQPDEVTDAVLSHLHFDHAGGVGDIPHARLLVSRQAWDHMVTSPHPERAFVSRPDILVPGAKWQLMDFHETSDPALAPFDRCVDVMGDGSLIVLDTPGHLEGSVSLLIRRGDEPPILLIGDLTYSEELLQRDQVAATGDRKTLLRTFAKVRALKAHTPERVIIASHDTTAVDKLAAAQTPSGADITTQ